MSDPTWPGASWESKAPGELGLDAAKLDRFRDHVGGRGCVVRHGYMGYAWGEQDKRADVASACKPWITHFLMLAHEEGKLDIHDEVRRWEPRLDGLNASAGFKDRSIDWRHMSCQVSCYGVREDPGSAYDYSDYNMALLFDTLFLEVYGTTWENVDRDCLRPMLARPLQCEDDPTFMAFGTGDRPGRVGVSVRDFARFGLLYLRKGRWKERQLLREDLAEMVVSSPIPPELPRTTGDSAEMIPEQRSHGGGNNQCAGSGWYSYTWWVNGLDAGGKRPWPDAPPDAFGAFGHGAPRAMWVMPGLDVVVSYNDTDLKKDSDWSKTNRAMKLLRAAAA